MTREELDRALESQAAAPAQSRPASPVRPLWESFRPPAQPRPEDVESDRQRKRAAHAAHLARVQAARAELAPRIKDPKLLERLSQLDTRSALLLGPSGVGKTAAAHWARARHRGLWAHARYLGMCERRHSLGEGEPQLLLDAKTTPVLYLDDIGAEDSRDIGVLQYVIEHRYANALATFATSGLTAQALSSYVGAPYVRRLIEQHVKRPDGSEWPVLFVDCHPPESPPT